MTSSSDGQRSVVAPGAIGKSTGSACAAAVLSSSLCHPFDLIKTRMHVATASGAAIPVYRGTLAAVNAIRNVEGVVGLYKGLPAAVVAAGASWALFRFGFDLVRGSVDEALPSSPFAVNLTSGLVSGVFATLCVHPLWFVKARLELQSHESKRAGWVQYRGGVDCVSTIVRKEGLRGLYPGIGPAVALVPHIAVQMVAYEEMKKRNLGSSATNYVPRSWLPFAWGAISKCIAVVMTYPFQVLRTRMQMQGNEYDRTSFVKVAGHIGSTEGPVAFYRGFTVHLQRACVHSGLFFLLFELFLTI